jgi:class 3 adenylate cyclase
LKSSVEGLHRELPEDGRLSFGIGIHAGEALLGLVGTQQRVEYTAIGDCVNTAKRLQENAAAGQILISRETAKAILKSIEVVELPPIVAEGKEKPIEVYEIVGVN